MNPDACRTLQTRIAYNYLRKTDNLYIYRQYQRGEIDRDKLYSYIPRQELDTVMNHTMSKNSMPELFRDIDAVMKKTRKNSVDLVVGGPPCQAYSLVGRARTPDSMLDDPRNFLYLLYCRVLLKYQPEIFVFENVPGLLTASEGKYFANMKKAFRRFGYVIEDKTLNAFDFGVLQNRRRVILIGWKKGTKYNYPDFNQMSVEFTVNDVFNDLPAVQAGETNNRYRDYDYSSYLKSNEMRTEEDILTLNIARPHNERDREIYRMVINAWVEKNSRLKYSDLPENLRTHRNLSSFLDRFKVIASDLPASHTVTAHLSKDGHYFIHPDICQARSITVREAARLQSFPDSYYFEGSRTSVLTQIGNAVPPLMAKGIACGILNELQRKE